MKQNAIETARLFLYPASDEELQKMIAGEEDPEMKQAYSEMLQGCINEPGNRIWYALWNMELKERPGTIVGTFCFKGIAPDGMVEIGYGLRKGCCGKGYMTEAVAAVAEWAFAQEGVTRIEAETAFDNEPSKKVLHNAGFVANGEIGEEGPRFVLVREKGRKGP